MRRLLE